MGAGRITKNRGRQLALFAALTWGFTMWSRTAFNYYTDALGINASRLGAVNFMTSIGSMLGAIILCRIADNRNCRTRVLGCGLLLSAAMQGLICLSSSFGAIIACRFIMGFGLGCAYSLTQAIVENASLPKERPANAGIVENGEAVISTMIGPMVIVFAISRIGWRGANAMLALPVFLIAVIWLRISRKTKGAGTRPREQAAERVTFGALLKVHNMKLCIILGVLTLTNVWTMYSCCPMYWSKNGYSDTEMSTIMTAMGLVAILACFVLPAASNRLGRKKIAGLFAVLNAGAYLLLFLYPGSIVSLVCFVAFGGSACTLSMFFMALITTESVKPQYAASAISLVNATSEICGGAVGPLAAGLIADAFGVKTAMLFAAVCMAAAAVLVTFLKETAPGLEKER